MTTQDDKDNNNLYVSILSFAKEGASKEDIAQALSISHQQLRRLAAELVDRDMLRLDVNRRLFVTTDKGHVFLQSRKTRRI